jgi:hypothetical protein
VAEAKVDVIWPASAVHTGLKWQRLVREYDLAAEQPIHTWLKWALNKSGFFPVLSCFRHHPCRPKTSPNFSQKAFLMSFESWNLCISYVVDFPVFSNIRYRKNVAKTSLICIAMH